MIVRLMKSDTVHLIHDYSCSRVSINDHPPMCVILSVPYKNDGGRQRNVRQFLQSA